MTNFTATASTAGVCHSGANSNTTAYARSLVVCSGAPSDIAEFMPVSDSATSSQIVVATTQVLTYEADHVDAFTGMISGKDTLNVAYVEQSGSAYQTNIIGIVSTSPAQVYGRGVLDATDQAAPVAITGRVPTGVSVENGPIKAGDPITSSSVAGVGMKSTKPGMIVGYALDSWDGPGQGTILVLLDIGFHSGLTITTDGVKSLFNDDFSFSPTAVASASSTPFSSFSLDFRGSAWDSASNTAVSRSFTMLNRVTDASNYVLAFQDQSGNDLMKLDQGGNLEIAGTLTSGGGFDYAELFPAVPDLEAGDVVMVDATNENGYGVKKSDKPYENSVIGIISSKPGFLTGRRSDDGSEQPVALAGRVPVKVNLEGGAVSPGDPLTSSSTPGVAMKATEPGRVIGIALGSYADQGTGVITIFVNPSWWNGPMPVGDANADSGLTIAQDSLIDMKNSTFANVAGMVSSNGLWSITSDGFLVAQDVEAKTVRAEKVSIKAAADAPERTVGVGRIEPGHTAALIQNPAVKASSLIVVTFEGNPGSSWWISDKQDGQFAVSLAAPPPGPLKFTYWLVGVEGVLDPTADGSATTTPETPPEPPPEAPPADSSASGTPETPPPDGSGTSTDQI